MISGEKSSRPKRASQISRLKTRDVVFLVRNYYDYFFLQKQANFLISSKKSASFLKFFVERAARRGFRRVSLSANEKINKILGVGLLTLSPSISILLTKGRPGVNAKRPSFRFFLHFFKNFSTKRRLIGKRVKMRSLRRVVKTVCGRSARRPADGRKS